MEADDTSLGLPSLSPSLVNSAPQISTGRKKDTLGEKEPVNRVVKQACGKCPVRTLAGGTGEQ